MRVPIHLSAQHPAFAGHFPGQPIVPGVVWLSAAVEEIQNTLNLQAAGYEIQNVKFLSMVRQSDILRGDSFVLDITPNLSNQEPTQTSTVRFTLMREGFTKRTPQSSPWRKNSHG